MVKQIAIYGMLEQLLKSLLSTAFLLTCTYVQASKLEDALESALKIDPALRASRLNQQASDENIAIARARFLPQILLQGSSSQLTQTTTQDLQAGGSSSRSFTGPSVNHQFVIRQAIMRPKERSLISFAELQKEYMSLKYKYDVGELKAKVIYSWIDLIATRQIAQAFERPLRLMQAAAIQEHAKYEKGEGTKDAFLESDAQYENAKATHSQAVEAFKAKQKSFEMLTKIRASTLLDNETLLEPIKIFDDSEKAGIWANFRDSSLELQMSKLLELMQLERLISAEADHKPTLDLLAAVNLAQNDATSTQGYQYKNKQLGLQYTVPLFAGGGISAAARQANLLYQASVVDSEALSLRLESDFENTWGQVIGTGKRQKALLDLVKAAEVQVHATSRGYELGVKSIYEMSVVETLLARRVTDLILVTQDYSKNLVKLKKFFIIQ